MNTCIAKGAHRYVKDTYTGCSFSSPIRSAGADLWSAHQIQRQQGVGRLTGCLVLPMLGSISRSGEEATTCQLMRKSSGTVCCFITSRMR